MYFGNSVAFEFWYLVWKLVWKFVWKLVYDQTFDVVCLYFYCELRGLLF